MKKLLAAFLAVSLMLISTAFPASADNTVSKSSTISFSEAPVFITEDGTQVVGSVEHNGDWYYYREDGTIFTGWGKTASGHYRYYDPDSGKRASGWRLIDGKYYFFRKSNGNMLVGTYIVGGKVYTFGTDGVWDGKVEEYEPAPVYSPLVPAEWGTSAADIRAALTAKGVEYDFVEDGTASIIMPLEAQVVKAGGISVIAFEFYFFYNDSLVKTIAAPITTDELAVVSLPDLNSKNRIKISELNSYQISDFIELSTEELAAFTKAQHINLVALYGEPEKTGKTGGYIYGIWWLEAENTYLNTSSVLPYSYALPDGFTAENDPEYQESDDRCWDKLREKHQHPG